MGLPELKSIRRFGLGRRSLKEPEKRVWAVPEASATTGRLPGAGAGAADQRDPAALRAYTTPNICVQAGRIEFIRDVTPPLRVERESRPTDPPRSGPSSPRPDKGLKEEVNLEKRRIHPAPVDPATSPESSPAPGKKVRDRVARFEQLVNSREGIRNSAGKLESPAGGGSGGGEARPTQHHLEAEIHNLERGLEEECNNFKRWHRQAQKTAGETRVRQQMQLLDISVDKDKCRDRLFSMQEELKRMTERLKVAEDAKLEVDKKCHDMEAILEAREVEREEWRRRIGELTAELELLRSRTQEKSSAVDQAGAATATRLLAERARELEERVRELEQEKTEQERIYERCLDDVANQIVQALLKQKTLQDGLACLRRRVHELEHENAVLYSLLGRAPTSGIAVSTASTQRMGAPESLSTDDEKLRQVRSEVRRRLEERYSPSSRRRAAARSDPLRWSQLTCLLTSSPEDTAAGCLHCASHACDPDCRLHRSYWTAWRGSSSAGGRREAPPSDQNSAVSQRLLEVAVEAEAAQSRLLKSSCEQRPTAAGKNCPSKCTPATKDVRSTFHSATVNPRLEPSASAVPRTLPLKTERNDPPPLVSPEGSSKSKNASVTTPTDSGAKSPLDSSTPLPLVTTREDTKRETEGRDEGYSTMSSDVQANDSGVSVSSVEVPSTVGGSEADPVAARRPRLEDLREVQEEEVRSSLHEERGSVHEERRGSVSSSDSENMRSLVEALRASLRLSRQVSLIPDRELGSDVLYMPLSVTVQNRHSCFVPGSVPRPIHRCRSDSRLYVKRWASGPSSSGQPWDSRAPERSCSTLELGAASTLDTRRTVSLKRAAAKTSLEHASSESDDEPAPSASFVTAALPWHDGSSELWRNCYSVEAREMEDWSLNLSAEEIRSEPTDENCTGSEKLADSSDYSRVGSYPNIQEAIQELEEDSSECLWNNASYLRQHPAILPSWPYSNVQQQLPHQPLILPNSFNDTGVSWPSSDNLNLFDIKDPILDLSDKNEPKNGDCDSSGLGGGVGTPGDKAGSEEVKRNSNGSDALSTVSVVSEDERPETIDTDFTREFYRLVKYESSKSLALSETSTKGDDEPEVSSADREMALASMLDFITEQQRYIEERESQDLAQTKELPSPDDSDSGTMDQSSSSTVSVVTKNNKICTASEQGKVCSERSVLDSTIQLVKLAQICEAEKNELDSFQREFDSVVTSTPEIIVYRAEISTNHKEYTPSAEEEKAKGERKEEKRKEEKKVNGSQGGVTVKKEVTKPAAKENEDPAKIGSPKQPKSGIPRSPLIGKRKRSSPPVNNNNVSRIRPPTSPKVAPKTAASTKVEAKETKTAAVPPPAPTQTKPSPKLLRRFYPGASKIGARSTSESAIVSGKRKSDSSVLVRSAEGTPPARRSAQTAPVSPPVRGSSPVQQRASRCSRIPRLRGSRSTDSREMAPAAAGSRPELVRAISEPAEIADSARRSPLIVSVGEVTSFHQRVTSRQLIDELRRLSHQEAEEAPVPELRAEEGCETGWVRVDNRVDLSDEQVRSELYDFIRATTRASSDSSSESESGDVTPRAGGSEYQHLKWVHQARRRKQVSRRKDGALRYTPVFRAPIINRPELFTRYGPQEREALATFDFLNQMTSSGSDMTSTGKG